jgi:hypothetical protein
MYDGRCYWGSALDHALLKNPQQPCMVSVTLEGTCDTVRTVEQCKFVIKSTLPLNFSIHYTTTSLKTQYTCPYTLRFSMVLNSLHYHFPYDTVDLSLHTQVPIVLVSHSLCHISKSALFWHTSE